jgi:hypothetical protein
MARSKTDAAVCLALGQAFDFFNDRLFEGRLPVCLIGLGSNQDELGCFWIRRFALKGGERLLYEIYLNPKHLRRRWLADNLATLAHEMVHLEQTVFGKFSSRHDQDWRERMRRIGIVSRHVGPVGGEQTHQYVEPGGAFEQACGELVNLGFRLDDRNRYRSDAALRSRQIERLKAAKLELGKERLFSRHALNELWWWCGALEPRMTQLQERLDDLTPKAAPRETPAEMQAVLTRLTAAQEAAEAGLKARRREIRVRQSEIAALKAEIAALTAKIAAAQAERDATARAYRARVAALRAKLHRPPHLVVITGGGDGMPEEAPRSRA